MVGQRKRLLFSIAFHFILCVGVGESFERLTTCACPICIFESLPSHFRVNNTRFDKAEFSRVKFIVIPQWTGGSFAELCWPVA